MSPFREFGWFAGSLYAIDRVFQRVSPGLRLDFYEIMVQPVPDMPLLPGRLGKSVEMREIKRGDPELDRMPARREIKESRFEQDAVCLGAFQKGQLIGYIWFCFRGYEEDEVRATFVLTPPDQAVFDFDLYVFPEHRMGLGFAAVWNGANTFLRRRGIRFSFSRLTRFNLSSRRAHKHLGSKLVARTFFLRAWGVEVMAATLYPYVHVSTGNTRRVRLTLRPDVLQAGAS